MSPNWIRNGAKRHLERLRSVSGTTGIPGRPLAPRGLGRRVFRVAHIPGDVLDADKRGAGGGRLLRRAGGRVGLQHAALLRYRPREVLSWTGRTPSSAAMGLRSARVAAPVATSGTVAGRVGPTKPKSVFRGLRARDAEAAGLEYSDRAKAMGLRFHQSLAPASTVTQDRVGTDRVWAGPVATAGFREPGSEAAGAGQASVGSGARVGGLVDGRGSDAPSDDSGTAQAAPAVSVVHIDGAELGRWTIEHLSRVLARPPMGMTSIDPRSIMPRNRIAPF